MTDCRYVAFPTALQWMAVCWTEQERLASLSFARASQRQAVAVALRRLPAGWHRAPASRNQAPASILALIERLAAFADGGDGGDFRQVPLELSDRTPFQRRVLLRCQAVPPGETVSYGELARRAGSPRAARAAGSVMAANRTPLVVPCHRVVASDGGLRGFSAPQGLRMKRRLLALDAG